MNNFDTYDLRMWFDKVLSRHPHSSTDRKVALRSNSTQITRLIFPVAAVASLLVLQGTTHALDVGQQLSVSAGPLVSAPANSIYWLGSTLDALTGAPGFSGLESRATVIANQLRTGKLFNVSAETRDLAKAVVARTSSNSADWIASVAQSVARLTD